MVGDTFTKFEFSIEELSQNSPLETYALGTLPKVLKLKTDIEDTEVRTILPDDDVNTDDSVSGSKQVTGLKVAEREDVIGKDLNNDNTIGLKVVGQNVASIATGTALGIAEAATASNVNDTLVEKQTIYVVGKSLATMGATSSRTANQNALRAFENDVNGNQVQVYWKPIEGETIRSIVEAADNIKVYARADADTTAMTEYTFTRSDGTGFAGWNMESFALIDGARAIVDLEMSNQRDLNGDNTIGLKYVLDEGTGPGRTIGQNITGAIKGSLGDETFYFAGIASRGTMNGTTPLGIDAAKLLKNVDGAVWQPPGTITTQQILDSVDRVRDATAEVPVPESATFVIRGVDSGGLAFFNSEYTQVT